MPTNDALNRVTLAGAQTIHGGGSKANGGNRWFDKTVQVQFLFFISKILRHTMIKDNKK